MLLLIAITCQKTHMSSNDMSTVCTLNIYDIMRYKPINLDLNTTQYHKSGPTMHNIRLSLRYKALHVVNDKTIRNLHIKGNDNDPHTKCHHLTLDLKKKAINPSLDFVKRPERCSSTTNNKHAIATYKVSMLNIPQEPSC